MSDAAGTNGYASRSHVTRLERQLDNLDKKFDAYVGSHSDRHEREQRDFSNHIREAESVLGRVAQLERASVELDQDRDDHDRRLGQVEVWRAELRGAFKLGQLAFGTSVLSAITAIAALVTVLAAH